MTENNWIHCIGTTYYGCPAPQSWLTKSTNGWQYCSNGAAYFNGDPVVGVGKYCACKATTDTCAFSTYSSSPSHGQIALQYATTSGSARYRIDTATAMKQAFTLTMVKVPSSGGTISHYHVITICVCGSESLTLVSSSTYTHY